MSFLRDGMSISNAVFKCGFAQSYRGHEDLRDKKAIKLSH